MPDATPVLLAARDIHVWDVVLEMLLLVTMALVLGSTAELLRQSAIVGYLLAGTLVGPSVLGWVSEQERMFAIAELGVALLLFTIGLEFSPRQLLRLGRVPLAAGPLQVVVTLGLALGICALGGMPLPAAFVVGAMVALSSTACVLRLLADAAEIDSPYGRSSLGILLVQDAAVVPLVLVVTALSQPGGFASLAGKLTETLMLAVLLIAAFYVAFVWVAPRLVRLPVWRRNRDFPILFAVLLAMGSAWVAQQLQLSPALGAFVAGVLLAASPYAVQIQADVQPLKAVMVTLFFASIGMLGDARWLATHLPLVLAIVAAVVFGKTVVTALLCWSVGQTWRFAVATGLCLAQVGEFSFVLATIARGTASADGLLSDAVFRAIVSATLLTLLLTPYLVRAAPRWGAWFEERLRQARRLLGMPHKPSLAPAPQGASAEALPDDLILIIGFGHAGQRVAEGLLSDFKERIVVLDLNPDNVEVGQRYGLRAIVGDACQRDVLEHAGIYRAGTVVITLPHYSGAVQVLHHVRRLAPAARVIVRSRYHIHHFALVHAGADAVVDEEEQVGKRMAAEVRAGIPKVAAPTSETPAEAKVVPRD